MNACEDQSEPLGEHPEIPVRGDAGIGGVLDAINRGAMLGVLAAADAVAATAQLAERQTQAINAIREIHYAVTSSISGMYCHECLNDAPCATIRAIDEADV